MSLPKSFFLFQEKKKGNGKTETIKKCNLIKLEGIVVPCTRLRASSFVTFAKHTKLSKATNFSSYITSKNIHLVKVTKHYVDTHHETILYTSKAISTTRKHQSIYYSDQPCHLLCMFWHLELSLVFSFLFFNLKERKSQNPGKKL